MARDLDEPVEASRRFRITLKKLRKKGVRGSTPAKRIRRVSLTDRLFGHPGRLSMMYFAVLIVIATVLLLMPFATQTG